MFKRRDNNLPAERLMPAPCNHDDKLNEILTCLNKIAERVEDAHLKLNNVQELHVSTMQQLTEWHEAHAQAAHPIDKLDAIKEQLEYLAAAEEARATHGRKPTRKAKTEETPANG